MKKIFKISISIMCLAMVGVMAFFFTSCAFDTEGKVKAAMSEECRVFFEGENHNFKATLECGMREEPYEFNGKSETKQEFGVIKVTFKAEYNDSKAGFILMNNNGENKIGELEENPFDGSYMADVEIVFSEDAEIAIDVCGEVVPLVCKSKDFEINYEEAIKIAVTQLDEKLGTYMNATGLDAECYLKVINNQKNGFEDYFWYFSIYGKDGKTHSCVINVVTGEVLSSR